MLYDLVPLPMRYREGSAISSVVPIFHEAAGEQDAIDWLGWEVDINALLSSGCCKYKTVEIWNNATIERTFMTRQPLDLSNPGWVYAEEPIYPIFERIFDSQDQRTIATYRYLNGITAMLQLSGIQVCRTRTVHDLVMATVQRSRYQRWDPQLLQQHYNTLLSSVIVGDEKWNIDRYVQVLASDGDPALLDDQGAWWEMECSQPDDPWMARCIDAGVTLKSLNLPADDRAQLGISSAIAVSIVLPFDPAGTEVKYSEDQMDSRWLFLRMVALMQAIPATDYVVQLTLQNHQVVGCEQQCYNRYRGYGHPQASLDQIHGIDRLIEAFAAWHWSRHPGKEVTQLFIERNWLDEAYLSIQHSSGESIRYYVDFTMYQIASLSALAE